MFEEIKKFAIEQVLWAEKNLRDKSGAEKKAAVVKKLDDMITLPPYLEWVDDIIIGKLVDIACEKLNTLTGHNFEKLELSEKQKQELVAEIEDPKEKNYARTRKI